MPRAQSALAMTGGFVRGAVDAIVRRGGALPLPRATARVAPTEGYKQYRGRDDVGSELSAASGRGSEVSEWPRSKLGASAVRQRKNFGHRNRIIVPYGGLQEVRLNGASRTPPPTECNKKCGRAGRCGHRPLRKRNKKCGEVRNPPVTAAPCQPPLGKGAGTGVRIATGAKRPRNDRGGYMGCGTRPGGSSGRPTPTHHSPIELRRGRRPRRPALPWARCALAMTGGFTRGAVQGCKNR